MRAVYFFGFILSFIMGVALEYVLGFGYAFGVLCLVLSLLVFLLGKCSQVSLVSYLVSLVIFGCALGVFRVDVSQVGNRTYTLDMFSQKVVTLTGVILEEPDVRENYTNIVLDVQSVRYDDKGHVLENTGSFRVLLRTPTYPVFVYGDKISVTGKVVKPKNITNAENGRVFDYRAYLAKDAIFHEMYFPNIVRVSEGNGNILREKLFAFKGVLVENIARMIPEPEASLAGGITLGAKQSLGNELLQKFRETGLAHIVVLSGYNIAIVALVVARVFVFLPFVWRVVSTVLGITLFAVLVGGGATVVRATLMALVVILARAFGRDGDALRALALVGGVMVALNPMILFHDVSFQLSFMATLAIITLAPIIERYFLFITNTLVREILMATVATQVAVAPILLYHMGSVSLVGFVANIFVLPFVPVAMMLVTLVALFAWIPFFGFVVALMAHIMLAYILLVADIGSQLPFASLHVESFGVVALLVSYTVMLSVYLSLRKVDTFAFEKPRKE